MCKSSDARCSDGKPLLVWHQFCLTERSCPFTFDTLFAKVNFSFYTCTKNHQKGNKQRPSFLYYLQQHKCAAYWQADTLTTKLRQLVAAGRNICNENEPGSFWGGTKSPDRMFSAALRDLFEPTFTMKCFYAHVNGDNTAKNIEFKTTKVCLTALKTSRKPILVECLSPSVHLSIRPSVHLWFIF